MNTDLGGGESDELVTFVGTFFVEKDEVLGIIRSVCTRNDTKQFEYYFSRLEKIMVKYQEQPTILNSSLSELMAPMTDRLEVILLDIHSGNEHESMLVEFEELSKIIQLICRVRGHKHIVKHFPHSVQLLEPCFFVLAKDQTNAFYKNWETKYVLILWLRMLCLLPFDICSIDSSLDCVGFKSSKLINGIVQLCSDSLSDTGPTRELSACCLATLLTRPEMEADTLGSFIRWCESILSDWVGRGSDAQGELSFNSFQVIGVLRTLGLILKTGHRDKVLVHCKSILNLVRAISDQPNQTMIRKLTIKLLQRIGMTYLPPKLSSWRYQRGQRSLEVNMKRAEEDVALIESNDDDDDDVELPEEMDLIFEHMILCLSDKDTIVRWSAAKGMGRLTARLDKSRSEEIIFAIQDLFCDEDAESAWHGGCMALAELARRGTLLPETLDSVVPLVVSGMVFDILRGYNSIGAHVRDASCYVCWAFARAYSPLILKPYMVRLTASMLITALFDREVNCRRAASAAFQENVGRQGNENFPHGLEVMAIADYFALGNISSCYLELAPAVAKLDGGFYAALWANLMHCKLGHWDSAIRTLAAKALSCFAPIDPSTIVQDSLATLIANCLSENTFLRHGSLLAVGGILRRLASAGVAFEASVSTAIVSIIPEVIRLRLFRGKASESIRAACCLLIEDVSKAHLAIPPKLQTIYVDALNENLRQPFADVQSAAQSALREFLKAYFPFDLREAPSKLQDVTVSLYVNALSKEDNAAATRGYALALGALNGKLALLPQGRLSDVIGALEDVCRADRLIGGEVDPETRRNALESIVDLFHSHSCMHGFSAAAAIRCWEMLLRGCDDYTIDKRGDAGSWSRLAALKGLYGLMTMSLDSAQNAVDRASPLDKQCLKYSAQILPLRTAKRKFLKNFLTSKRMNSNDRKTRRCVASKFDCVSNSCISYFVNVSLKLMSEKLDAVRLLSGELFSKLLRSNLLFTHTIADAEVLLASALKHVFADRHPEDFQWGKSHVVYPLVSKLLGSFEYFRAIFMGIVVSAGGLSDSLAKEARAALLDYYGSFCSYGDKLRGDLLFADTLFLFYSSRCDDERLSLPLLNTLDFCLKNSLLNVRLKHVYDILQRILASIKTDLSSCTNVKKILTYVNILVDCMSTFGPVRSDSFSLLLILLGHKFPRIRRVVAESLYLQLIADDAAIGPAIRESNEIFDNFCKSQESIFIPDSVRCGFALDNDRLSAACEVLTSTSWEGSIDLCREKRASVCIHLGVETPAVKPKEKKVIKKPKSDVDELDSYSSLVREVGY